MSGATGPVGPGGPTGLTGPTGKSFFTVNIVTSDPHVVGQVWSNAGVLTISAG
jgi:hypothetical protein